MRKSVNEKSVKMNRRDFLKGALATGAVAAAAGSGGMLTGCAPKSSAASDGEVVLDADSYTKATWSFEVPPEPIPAESISETVEAEIVIVGAGTSGLVTGMAAAENGVDVCVIASSDKPVSRGGSNAAFNSKLQKELGREFPLEEAKKYFQEEFAAASFRIDQDKWWDFYNYSGEAIDWLSSKMADYGIQTVLENTHTDPDGSLSIPSFSHTFITKEHPEAGASQQVAVEAMAEEIVKLGGRIDYTTTAEQLEKDSSGRVVAAIAKKDGSYVRYVGRRGVVLATGDFSMDKDMVAKYCPIALPYGLGGVFDGSGHKMGLWAGAAWQKYTPNAPMIVTMGDEVLPCRWWAEGAGTTFQGLLVNNKGLRYGDEDSLYGYQCWPQKVQPGGYSFLIWDDKWVENSAPWQGDYIGAPDRDTQEIYDKIKGIFVSDAGSKATDEYAGFNASMGTAVMADTLEELAEGLGFEGQAKEDFLAQVERYNQYCATGVDEEFHKAKRLLLPVVSPPFYGVKNEPYTLCITGGLNVNRNQEVCDENNDPIPGLYGVGTIIGDVIGDTYNFRIWGHNLGCNCVTAGHRLGTRFGETGK